MKTRMNENSIEAFAEVALTERQKEVFEIISSVGNISAKGIAYAMKVPINKVTGRINELMHKQKVKVATIGKDVYGGKNVNYYAVRKVGDPLNVFDQSWEERFIEMRNWLDKNHPAVLHEFSAVVRHEV